MAWLFWIPSVALTLLSALIVLFNGSLVFRAPSDGRSISPIPLLGGLFGATGIWLCPLPHSAWWALLPFALDITWWSLPWAVYMILHEPPETP